MLVNKCDKCDTQYKEGDYPDWLQITGDRGVTIVNANKAAVKFSVLDFCCPDCMKEFFIELSSTMKPVQQV